MNITKDQDQENYSLEKKHLVVPDIFSSSALSYNYDLLMTY